MNPEDRMPARNYTGSFADAQDDRGVGGRMTEERTDE